MNLYSPHQREIWFSTVAFAEAAARDFQRRGYRRRTRGLAPGDVLVAEATEGFSLLWAPRDQAPLAFCLFSPLPVEGGAMGEGPGVRASGPGGGTGEAGSWGAAR